MFQNIGLKFLALLFALIFWGSVISLKNNIKNFQEPVALKPFNISENLTLAQSLGNVSLKLEASQEVFKDLSVNDFEAYVDLKGLNAGSHNVSIQVTSKNPRVKVVKFEPDNVDVILEAITSKMVNLDVEVKGNVAENFEAQDALFEIKEAEVKGAKNLIEQVTEVKAIVNLKGTEMTNIKTEVTLFAYDKNQMMLRDVDILPTSLEILIPVIQIQKYKTVGIRAALIGDLKDNLFVKKVIVSPSTVVIQGNTKDLKAIDFVDTESIEIEGLDHNTLKRVNLNLPAGIVAQDVQSVLVTIEIAENINP